MTTSWDHPPSGKGEVPREFIVNNVELYLSQAASAAFRKPLPAQRKKLERRDSIKPLSNPDDKKLKEKHSWLSLSKATSSGQWRSATCKLSEEGDRCLLNIYVDETMLYQTVSIHLLNHTDIREADSSLFFRKYCLGVYGKAAQRWNAGYPVEPIYLHFPNVDSCHSWLALLRSYAIPEIYGRYFFKEDGGSYRMWRQVELTVQQGRYLGSARFLGDQGANGAVPPSTETNQESEAIDMDVSCEIFLNDVICGRTTVKKGIGSPDWHESFTFPDLPPFEMLDVNVWREKKLFKPTMMGSVRITLSNFRRGEAVEGWFPVLHSGVAGNDIQVGEIRLKIRVDEEIILPATTYEGLLEALNSRNFLDWMIDFETKLHLKTITTQLMSIAVARNVLIPQVQELADREVDGTPSSHQTLFRGNTILTKVMEACMSWYGKAFLEASIGDVLRRLCDEKVAIEVDPVRSGKSTRDMDKNRELLIQWCERFWAQIHSVRNECPNEMRKLFEHVRKLVEGRYNLGDLSQEQNRDLPWQSVSAFCFLRFIVPAILHPHLFGLCPGLPNPAVKRSLTLVAKVMQSLANLNASVQKEEFMRGIKDFLADNRESMIDYLIVISTPTNEPYDPHPTPMDGRHSRLHIVNHLRNRAAKMPVLNREAIPILPDLLDTSRHLSIIASAVIRHSRDYSAKKSGEDDNQALDALCTKCFEVEEHALRRVSKLATRMSTDRRASVASSPVNPLTPTPSNSTTAFAASSSSNGTRRSRKSTRPSTAPSASDSDTPRHRQTHFSGPSSPNRPLRVFGGHPPVTPSSPPGAEHNHTRKRLKSKSKSIENMPTSGLDSGTTKPEAGAEMSDDTGKGMRGLGIFRGILRR